MKIEFKDNSMQVVAAIGRAIETGLEEAGGEFAAQAQRNSRVDTGDTKNSFQHKVTEDAVHVGSSAENAIWEEFGTGIHAEHGGRKTTWAYKDRNGNWHTTNGKRGTRALTKAMRTKAGAAKKIMAAKLKEAAR